MTIEAQIGLGSIVREARPLYKDRISRDELFMAVANIFALRSTCVRGHTGCVAVQDRHIVAHGYNGAPPGQPHCYQVGCGGGLEGDNGEITFPRGCTRAIHAEANMVAYAARVGAHLEDCTAYMLTAPCLPCAQVLVAAGIRKMVYRDEYRLPEGLQLIDRADIEIVRFNAPNP